MRDHHDGAVEARAQRSSARAPRCRGAPRARRAAARRGRAAGRPRARRACAARPRGRASASRGRRRRARGRRAAHARGPRSPGRRQRPALEQLLLAARAAASSGRGRSPRARRAAPRPSRAPPRARPGRAARRAASSSASRSSPSSCCGRIGDARARGAASRSPASASPRPARIRSSVDLPPPFGPITPMRASGSTSRSSPSRIRREPKLFGDPAEPAAGTCSQPSAAQRTASPRGWRVSQVPALARLEERRLHVPSTNFSEQRGGMPGRPATSGSSRCRGTAGMSGM